MYVYMYVYIYICMYIYMYMYIYLYVYIYINNYTAFVSYGSFLLCLILLPTSASSSPAQ